MPVKVKWTVGLRMLVPVAGLWGPTKSEVDNGLAVHLLQGLDLTQHAYDQQHVRDETKRNGGTYDYSM